MVEWEGDNEKGNDCLDSGAGKKRIKERKFREPHSISSVQPLGSKSKPNLGVRNKTRVLGTVVNFARRTA